MASMRTVLVTMAAATLAALGLVACGDDGGDSTVASEQTTVAASSGDAEEADAGGVDSDDPEPEGDTAAGDTEAGDVQDVIDELDFGDGLARVTIGDTSYEFVLGGSETFEGTTHLGVCQELFGLLNGGGFVSGEAGTTIEFTIPPPDWESYDDGRFDSAQPRIEIELGDTGGWAADMTLAENFPAASGQSQIDEWTLDGSIARGRATFIEMESFSAPVDGSTGVEGSFEIGCEGS